MVYKVTRQVEDDIVYDDERDLDKSTFTESLRITFKTMAKSASRKPCKTTPLGVENGKRMAMT